MSAEYNQFFHLLPESNVRQDTACDQLQDPYGQPLPFDASLSNASQPYAMPSTESSTFLGSNVDPHLSPASGRLAGEPAYCSGRHCCKWSVAGCACNNHYPSAEDLDKHVAADHAGKHPNGQPSGDYHCHWAGCSKCESFGNKPKLTRHIHSHTGHKPHQCLYPGCGKGFVTKEQLKNHETTHTKTKEHICPECGKGFAVKTALTSHMNVHKGAKPYMCEECGKGFADSSNLSKHKAIHKRVAAKKHRHAAHRSSISSNTTTLFTPPPSGVAHHLHPYHHPADMLSHGIEAHDHLALCSKPCYDVQCADSDRVPCRSASPCVAAPCTNNDCGGPDAFEQCLMPQCDLQDCDFQQCDLSDCLEDCSHFCDHDRYDPGFCASEDDLCGRTPPPPPLQPSLPSQPSQQTTPEQRHVTMQVPEFELGGMSSHTLPGLEGMEFATTEGFKQLHDFIHGSFKNRSPSAVPPSSPPSVEHALLVASPSTHPPSSSPTPAHQLLSSPDIARLPPPIPPRTPASTRSRYPDNSSEYYTAVWGSPYELSPTWSRSARTAVSEQSHSDDLLDRESSPSVYFGLEHLVPNLLGELQLRPVQSVSPGPAAQELDEDDLLTPRSRTKRWIQLPRSQPSDRPHWWSGKSGRSVSEHVGKRQRRNSVLISDEAHFAKGHKSRDENRTLDQQTFLDTLRDGTGDMSGLYASRWATEPSSALTDKNEGTAGEEKKEEEVLPKVSGIEQEVEEDLPPVDETSAEWDTSNSLPSAGAEEMKDDSAEKQFDEVEKTNDATAGAEVEVPKMEATREPEFDEKDEESALVPAPAHAPNPTRLEPPRLKKRVSWRGKTCVVSIPNVDFEAHGLPKPMSSAEFQQRLNWFEDAGYNTKGFDLWPELNTDGKIAHVKPIYPDETESRIQAKQEGPKVSLPDLKKWAEHLDWLTEQKLAALGVSTGFDEPAPTPSQDMSRQSSGQYPPLPFSPPIPGTSAGSMSRPIVPRGHSHTMSVASPMSPASGPFGHMHRHSTFTGGFGFPQQPQLQSQHSPIPGMQTFSPLSFQFPDLARGGSPAQLAALRQESSPGPGSPLHQQILPSSSQDYSRGRMENQSRRQHAYTQSMQQTPTFNNFMSQGNSVHQTPALPELPEEEDEEELEEPTTPPYVPPHKRAQFNADISIPTPRSHRHNISESLERDLLEAEQRQKTSSNKYIEVQEEDSDEFFQPPAHQHEPSEHKTEQRPTVAEKDPLGSDYPVQEGTHSRKKSASRLNVTAPVFTFNPKASFQPTSTAFTTDLPSKTNGADHNNGTSSKGHSRQVSSGTFNAAAPVFKPSVPFTMPKTEFSFSSGPATSFPSVTPNASSPYITNDSGSHTKPKIFGEVNIPGIVKPSKKSKAIMIVRPEDAVQSTSASGTEREDEDGRIVQSDDRLKRQRKNGDDGDEVPQFAVPAPVPMPTAVDFAPKPPKILPSQPAPAVHTASAREIKAITDCALEEIGAKGAEAARDVVDHSREASGPSRSHKHETSGSLSALAKPFQPFGFKPGVDDKANEEEDDDAFDSISDLEDGEIRDDDEQEVAVVPQKAATESTHIEPSFDEIDAVMQQLNEAEADLPPEEPQLSPLPSEDDKPLEGVTYLPEWSRSDAPSPSPERRHLAPFPTHQDSSFTVHDRTDSGERTINGWPPVNRLNKAEEVPTSDWSGVLSAPDEEKLHERSRFFDNHIDEVLSRVVERRLLPLEESIRSIQTSFNNRARSIDHPKRSSSAADSDADDEDDLPDEQRHRPTSRGRDKRVDQIKAAVLEALREQSPRASQSAYDIVDLHSALADMKVSFARAVSASLELDDIRAVVEEVLAKQNQALVPIPVTKEADENVKTHRREMSELEGRLNETLAGALEEANFRRTVEEREAETRRLLRLAEEELSLLREANRDNDSRINAMEDERAELLDRIEKAEEALDKAENKGESIEAENEAMQATLEEYRKSSTKWRQGIDDAKHEQEELENTIADLERQLDEGQESSNTMRRRLEKLHTDMATAAGQLASEKATWKSQEEDYRARLEALELQRAAHIKQNEVLVEEVRSLRIIALEAAETKHTLESMRGSNASLEQMVHKLQAEVIEQQSIASRWERDFNDAREAGRAEVHRTRMSLEADVEAANHQVNIVRADLEIELSKMRTDLENVRLEAETAKARHNRLLDEEDVARREALRKVNQSNSVVLDETRHKHETIVRDMTAQHSRAFQHAIEDKQRSEHFMNERLALSEAKLQHFQERVAHLEERLAVTQSAAQAAAQSAKTKAPATSNPYLSLPEKVSPQALRESILVLQEQLQERESRIDRLQTQVQKEGPAKLKERDTEIAWLRELLAVRNEEIGDLVNTLSQPAFNRDTVRDTAIRIQANLQMEQQEKERFAGGSQTLSGQALASISSFAAPKAKQFFNTWRSSMESSALRHSSRPAAPTRSYTPPKGLPPSSHPPGYLTGMMTPPASNLRGTPSPDAMAALPPPRLHSQSRSTSKQPVVSSPEQPAQDTRRTSAASDAPTTPLFREQNYDQDAEDSQIIQSFEEDEDLNIADSEAPAFRSLEAELDEPSLPAVEDGTPA